MAVIHADILDLLIVIRVFDMLITILPRLIGSIENINNDEEYQVEVINFDVELDE